MAMPLWRPRAGRGARWSTSASSRIASPRPPPPCVVHAISAPIFSSRRAALRSVITISYARRWRAKGPLIRRLTGRSDIAPSPETARLGCDLPANDERADYLRATLEAIPDGVAVATPAPVQDSSMLMPLARADCLLVRAPFAPAAKAGERCSIIRLAP